MKNVAIFCDGTWNSADATDPTNVKLLHDAVLPETGGGVVQEALYIPGVGTREEGASLGARLIDRLGGGAFGWGLDAKLEEAYRDIVRTYRPGDRLFLFGFSRGAYTARSLAGLLRNSGLPQDGDETRVEDALTLYRKRKASSHPDAPEALAFRLAFSPDWATSATEQMVRGGDVPLLAVDYLGVWDTVGALGVPNHLKIASWFNGRYQFHDLRLSSMVKAARHAVAIDERRKTFPPTLWENLTDLNDRDPGADVPYRQEWFPGTHGGVGGGGPIRGLSDAALLWVAEGAELAGLAFDPQFLAQTRANVRIGDPLDNHEGQKGLITRLMELGPVDRAAPGSIHAVNAVAKERWRQMEYRPVPLHPFAPRMDPPVMPQDWTSAD
ncbi:MAG: hypothetical protein Q27BPR15_06295 [Rhodobacter sp. CACIA14H1]|nr:MAG: hypothetical protein Q27BPR15_06295 [Rhodobacter sp. CACIA14H1]